MSDNDCDWFDKDDEELLKDVQKTVKKQRQTTTEYIKISSSIIDYIIGLSIKAAEQPGDDAKKSKIQIADLRRCATMSSIDLLLHILTLGYDFYSEQIYLNDSPEKVMLYTSVLTEVCRLEMPVFREDSLKPVAYDSNLQQQYCLLLAKLMCTRYKEMWLKQADMLQFIKNMEFLILKASKIYRKEEKLNFLLKELLSILDRADNAEIAKKGFVILLKANISQALISFGSTEDDIDIYPTLEDLNKQQLPSANDMPYTSRQTEQEYVAKHLRNLKEEFFFPLKDHFDLLKNRTDTTQMPDNIFVFDDVLIMLNEKYLDAYRHELIFVDLLGTTRDMDVDEVVIPYPKYEAMKKIKTGSLLCFSSSLNFENLILATVTYTSFDCIREGFIGIEIVRQYNIGNIYDDKLIMFEAPVFFEPYHNVFKYLKNCNISSLPLKNYFVNGEVPNKQTPKYLNKNKKYFCNGKEFKPYKEEAPADALDLNGKQLRAYRQALIQEFCLIQGPPGTGKTHLSLQIVRTLIDNCDTPVVLVAYTNDSLDKFLTKVSQYTDQIVRFGGQSRDPLLAKFNVKDYVYQAQHNPNLKKLYHDVSVEFKIKFQTLQLKHNEFDNTDESYQEIVQAEKELAEVNEKLLNIKIMFQYYAVKAKSIIAFTTTYAAKINFLFRLLQSKIVIFEEAAEILESHVLACLTPYTQHVIMIGDHMQLKPYCTAHQLRHSRTNISFFEKLFKLQKNPLQLNRQYRMHPKFADLLSKTFYENLESDISVTQYPVISKMNTNLYFMDHTMPEGKARNDGSLYNRYEIEQIVKLALHLVVTGKYDVYDIHILSPYAKQVEYFKKELQKMTPLYSLNASTVDSFQGLEAKVILLSLVRSNSEQQIGFLAQPNRICVALSRAKHGMYIIGNLTLLSQCSPTWAKIQEKLIQLNALGAEFPIAL